MNEHADLSIGDVSKITGLPSHTIRYWEKEFSSFLSPNRTVGLQRRYDEKDIEIIEEIRHLLKVDGFSIAGAKRQLSHRYSQNSTSGLVPETTEIAILEKEVNTALAPVIGNGVI